jgi:hypothetical protein
LSKPKPVALPDPPAALPDGTFDCDPDPHGEIFAEMQNEHIARARHWVNTPADVLERERLRAEELEHERAMARIRTETQPQPKRQAKQNAFASRNPQKRATIARAAQEAGENNKLFCEFMQGAGISVPPTWGVRSWLAAWDNKDLHPSIRSFKRHYRYAA